MNHTTPLILGALLLAACDTDSASDERSRALSVGFDVSEDMSRFYFDDAPVFEEDSFPAAGNAFVTEGYIYPHGFLANQEGTTVDGQPAHPDEVLGTWTCRGWFVGQGAHTTEGPAVVTTQLFTFYDEPGYAPGKIGRTTLTTDGFEAMDPTPIVRPVTGGTGEYLGYRGEAEQVMFGLNESFGVELRIDFALME